MANKAMLHLIGGLRIDVPEPGDYRFLENLFERMPNEITDQGRPTRYVGYEGPRQDTQQPYFMGLEASLTKGVGATVVTANLMGSVREFGHQTRVQDEFNLISSGTSSKTYNFPVPLLFAEKTDFCPLAEVSANGVGVSWAFTVVLVDN